MISKKFKVIASESPKTMVSGINALQHHIAVKTTGTAGAIKIQGKAPGSSRFEDIPEAGAIDLADPVSIQVQGAIVEFLFTVSGADPSDAITVTSSFEVNN